MRLHHIQLPTIVIFSLTLLSCTQPADTLRIYEQEKVMMGTVMKIKAVAEGENAGHIYVRFCKGLGGAIPLST